MWVRAGLSKIVCGRGTSALARALARGRTRIVVARWTAVRAWEVWRGVALVRRTQRVLPPLSVVPVEVLTVTDPCGLLACVRCATCVARRGRGVGLLCGIIGGWLMHIRPSRSRFAWRPCFNSPAAVQLSSVRFCRASSAVGTGSMLSRAARSWCQRKRRSSSSTAAAWPQIRSLWSWAMWSPSSSGAVSWSGTLASPVSWCVSRPFSRPDPRSCRSSEWSGGVKPAVGIPKGRVAGLGPAWSDREWAA